MKRKRSTSSERSSVGSTNVKTTQNKLRRSSRTSALTAGQLYKFQMLSSESESEFDEHLEKEDSRVVQEKTVQQDEYDEEEEEGEEEEIMEEDVCEVCENGGTLLLCDTCSRVYHLSCLDPPLKEVPKGDWNCPACSSHHCEICHAFEPKNSLLTCDFCTFYYHMSCLEPPLKDKPKKKWFCSDCTLDLDEQSNPSQVEKILTRRTNPSENTQEYLIKWKNRSYSQCRWLAQKKLSSIARQKLRNFEKNFLSVACPSESEVIKAEWLIPQRVIASKKTKDNKEKFFVKWQDLPYDQCTWEFLEGHEKVIERFREVNQPADGKPSGWRKHKKDTSQFHKFTEQPSYIVGGKLHDYQIEGFNWLRFSWSQKRNVILADEMGLGKTVQTVSFLVSLREEDHIFSPFLIVVPLSTLRHWEREFELWTPQLNVITYTGSQQSRSIIQQYEFFSNSSKKSQNPKFNVLIASYEMILQDSSTLKQFSWECLVVDEAHRLKNNNSKLFKVLSTFKTNHRTLLTGTPLQNTLVELFHLLNFLTPKLFGSAEEFEREFSTLNKEDQIAKLHKLLAPHLLRRMKTDVMQGALPPKREFILRVELSPLQKSTTGPY